MLRRIQLIEKYSQKIPICRHYERIEKTKNSFKHVDLPKVSNHYIIDEKEYMKKLYSYSQIFV